MAKGGAKARSGPAPDPNALRRERDNDGWMTLPQEGRKGPVPAWPLTEASDRELVVWKREWKRPQAIMWERFGQQDEVALYVRSFADAEQHGASTMSRTLVRQLQESLGISLPGLARNHWRIGEVPSSRTGSAGGAVKASARGRFRVVTGGDGSAA